MRIKEGTFIRVFGDENDINGTLVNLCNCAMHTEEAIKQKAEIYYLQEKVKKMEDERK